MTVSATMVRDLREKTGAGMMDCKKALAEVNGDFEKAIEWLRKKGIANAAKKAGRATKEGAIGSYIHGEGRIGVMVEINCETDFVARTDKFKDFVRDVAMHIAAASPQYVVPEEVPASVLDKEKEIAMHQLKEQGKPMNMLEKIAEGKIRKFYDEVCLLRQTYVKNPDKTVEQVLKETIAALGENITIKRFARFGLGESEAKNGAATEESAS